jgi:hypothetical protein
MIIVLDIYRSFKQQSTNSNADLTNFVTVLARICQRSIPPQEVAVKMAVAQRES